jgi:hypothetical protein
LNKLFFLTFLFLSLCSCSPDEETQAPTNIVQTTTPEPETPEPVVVQYILTVTAGDGGNVTNGGTFDEGTDVTITATSNEGYRFTGWEGNSSTSESLTVTLDSNQTYEALFELIPLVVGEYTLSVIAGEGGTVNTGGTYDEGAEVTVTATANEGYQFIRWDNGTAPNSNDYNIENINILIGSFTRKPTENGYHEVEIISENGQLKWRNEAGVSWSLELRDGKLWTGPDCVYGEQVLGILIQNNQNVLTLVFNDEIYENVLYESINLASESLIFRLNSNQDYQALFELITYSATYQGNRGFSTYIGYYLNSSIENYGVGVSFYTAAWSLINAPLVDFQVGMPGTWIIPNNRENSTIPLCPVGTYARDNWDERGPTYQEVFQTLEGGVGYWGSNVFRNGSPKFSMNATPNCYTNQVASPGWPFFGSSNPLADDILGVAQISNRLLIPPDGITFSGSPNGEFLGYGYMALPFTDSYNNSYPVGDQSWTCFLNAQNFKGPIAYYLPEIWSKMSENYPTIDGLGLDSKPGIIGTGAMEVAMVPFYSSRDSEGTVFTRIPELNFPVQENGFAPILQDVTVYNKSAIYDGIQNWKSNNIPFDGPFLEIGSFKPGITEYQNPSYKQGDKQISGLDNSVQGNVQNSNVFGLQFDDSFGYNSGSFPEYYKESGGEMIPVLEANLPPETGLKDLKFKTNNYWSSQSYKADLNKSSWSNTSSGPFSVFLNDGSKVTYHWYRFIDQPVFKQFNWSDEKKQKLQDFIVKIHKEWTIDKNYMAPPSTGELVRIYDELIVTPPPGLEYGYVPIVTSQN